MDEGQSARGIFQTAGNGRNFRRRRGTGDALSRFALELSKHDLLTGDKGGNVVEVSRRLGINPSQGNAMLQRIRRRLGPQAV